MTRPPERTPVVLQHRVRPLAERIADRDRTQGDEEDRGGDLPDRVRLTLRVEAPEEVLHGGGVVAVLQAHEVGDDAHFTDADQLWLGEARTGSPAGPGSTSASLSAGRRGWATARPAAADAGPRPDGARR